MAYHDDAARHAHKVLLPKLRAAAAAIEAGLAPGRRAPRT
jgi:hypothetical protein